MQLFVYYINIFLGYIDSVFVSKCDKKIYKLTKKK